MQGNALDAGCGVGPLAVAMAHHRPGLAVTATDRLVLAVAFTAENARLNNVAVAVMPGLLLETPVPGGGWDLIVSNLPAKAGERVLRDFFCRSLQQISPGGLVAIVLVSTLAAWAVEVLGDCGAQVVYVEESPAYRVFHYRRPAVWPSKKVPQGAATPFPAAYLRGTMTFAVGTKTFSQNTYFGLPNFDDLDYRWKVSEALLALPIWKRASLLVWEPVQGHVATLLASALAPGGTLHLAGNDVLALRATACQLPEAVTHPVAGPQFLAGRLGEVQGAVFQVHSEPEVPWVDEARTALVDLLPAGAPLLINGTSTDLARFLEAHKGLRKQRDEKYRGWRAVLFQRT